MSPPPKIDYGTLAAAFNDLVSAYERFFRNPKKNENWDNCQRAFEALETELSDGAFQKRMESCFRTVLQSQQANPNAFYRNLANCHPSDIELEIGLATSCGFTPARIKSEIRRAQSRIRGDFTLLDRAFRRQPGDEGWLPGVHGWNANQLKMTFVDLHGHIHAGYFDTTGAGRRAKKKMRKGISGYARHRLFAIAMVASNGSWPSLFPYSHALGCSAYLAWPRRVPTVWPPS